MRTSDEDVATPQDETANFLGQRNDVIEVASEEGTAAGTSTVTASNIKKAMLIGVTYSSTIGGICTVVGTPTNMIALGIYSATYKEDNINFLTWFAFRIPISVLGMIITWIWVQIRFLDISFAEVVVGVFFVVLVILWILRDPRVFPGWGSFFPNAYAKDSTVVLFIGLLMFLFPSKSSSFTWIMNFWKNADQDSLPEPVTPLLDWKTFQAKFPWDILLLMCSGFALAEACVDSGLSEALGHLLARLEDSPPWVITLVISTFTSLATEFTSNVATTSILLPILLPLAKSGGIDPVVILLATSLSASFAFALPIATPGNALVLSVEPITIPDMIWTGLPLNFVFVAMLNILIPLSGPPIFGLEQWQPLNGTSPPMNSTWAA